MITAILSIVSALSCGLSIGAAIVLNSKRKNICRDIVVLRKEREEMQLRLEALMEEKDLLERRIQVCLKINSELEVCKVVLRKESEEMQLRLETLMKEKDFLERRIQACLKINAELEECKHDVWTRHELERRREKFWDHGGHEPALHDLIGIANDKTQT